MLTKPEAVEARDLRTYKHFDLLLAIFIVGPADLQPGRPKTLRHRTFCHQRRPTSFPAHLHLWRRIHRSLWLRRIPASHLAGLLANALLAIMGLITVWLPPAPGWHNQDAFATVFYQIPRLIVASLIAFWCGEFANSYTLARMKLWTGGRMLWTRTVGSTVVGQFVDTIVLVIIGFWGTAPPLTLATLAGSAYLSAIL